MTSKPAILSGCLVACLLGPMPGRAETVRRTPACPARVPPSTQTQRDYDRAGAVFTFSDRGKQMRDAHLRGELGEVLRLWPTRNMLEPHAGDDYVYPRVLEDCGQRRLAMYEYLDLLRGAHALVDPQRREAAVGFLRQELSRVAPREVVDALRVETPAEPAEARKAYRAALTRGRAAAERKQYTAAVAAFYESLLHARRISIRSQKSNHLDGPALAELGQIAFLQNDLDRAAEFLNRSFYQLEPAAKAGAFYQLGRVQEAQGEPIAALESYRRSLQLRPHAGVAERLAALEGPQPLEGPFRSIEALCAKLQSRQIAARLGETDYDCCDGECRWTCPIHELARLREGLAAPMEEVRVFVSRQQSSNTQPDEGRSPSGWQTQPGCGFTNAAVRVSGAWYVLPSLGNMFRANHMRGNLGAELRVETLASGQKVVRLQSTRSQDYKWFSISDEALTILGVGPSGRPSRIGPIGISSDSSGESKPKEAGSEPTSDEVRYSFTIRDDALLLTEKTIESTVGKKKRVRKEPFSARYAITLP